MAITAEQAAQAKDIIIDCLNVHHQGALPFREVWTKAAEDFDGVAFLNVWVLYDGKPSDLDIRKLNSFDPYLMRVLGEVGIHAITAIDYINDSDLDQLGTPWIG